MYEFTAWLPTRRFWARVSAFWQINKGWEWQEMVASRPTHIRHAGLGPASRFSVKQIKKRAPAQACPEPVEGAGVTMAASGR
jgi:hypothetical protein